MSDNVIDLNEYRKRKSEETNVVSLAQKASPAAAKEARVTRISEAMAKWGHRNGTETQKKRKNKERC